MVSAVVVAAAAGVPARVTVEMMLL